MSNIFMCGSCAYIGSRDELKAVEPENAGLSEEAQLILSKQRGQWSSDTCPECGSPFILYKTRTIKEKRDFEQIVMRPTIISNEPPVEREDIKVSITDPETGQSVEIKNPAPQVVDSEEVLDDGFEVHGMTPEQLRALEDFQIQRKKQKPVQRTRRIMKVKCRDCDEVFESKADGGGFGVRCKKCQKKLTKRI